MTVLVISPLRLLRERIAQMLTARGLAAVAVMPHAIAGEVEAEDRRVAELAVVDARDHGAAACVRSLTHRTPPVRVLLLGTIDDEASLVACLESGATGVLDAECGEDELWRALTRLRLDDVIVTPHVLAALLHRHGSRPQSVGAPTVIDQLTAREREVLSLLDRGLSNKEIAGSLHITVATVKHHVHRILEKLKVPRRSAAVAHLRSLDHPATG
jgi:two-component system, NarL family, nitrate/nitrite response regulator NarL